jgi:hypothetical protein
MHLTHYANHGEQFLQYIVIWDETSVNHMTFKTNIAFMMWEQPSSPTGKEFQSNAISEEVRGTVFCNHKDVDLHVVTLTSELHCGAMAGHLL